MTVQDVVTRVLADAGIASIWQLTKPLPVRAYVTQYEESGFELVERLLAEAGIYYFFQQPSSLVQGLEDAVSGALGNLGPLGAAAAELGQLGAALLDRETMLFADDCSAYPAIDDGGALSTAENIASDLGIPTKVGFGPIQVGVDAPSLHYARSDGASKGFGDSGTVSELHARRAVRANQTEFRDYDPDRPRLALVGREPKNKASEGSVSAKADISIDPTRGVTAHLSVDVGGTILEPPLEDYRHHGTFAFPDFVDAEAEPRRILLSDRRRADTTSGTTTCAALSPGMRFTLEDYPIAARNREYVVTRVKHTGNPGDAERVYANEIECVPSDVTFVPRTPTARKISAALTALVVGPAGEDVWVDSQGRIKIKFHWDRAGGHDGSTSCWIRSMQAWGGAGWGSQFIPRVGMEVVVVFENGDSDKPLVIGAVYNGTHPMPFAVPADRSRSGFKTASFKNAQDYNELSFEDAAGREQVYLRAQRDLDELVNHDHTVDVGGDEKLTIKGNRLDHVLKNHHSEIGGDREDRVKGKASFEHEVRLDVVNRNLDVRVGDTRTTKIAARDDLEITGPADHRFLADLTTKVVGNFTIVVGKHKAPRALTLRAEGTTLISSEATLELVAKQGVKITCGKSSIRIGDDGIELSGPLIHVGADKATMELGKDGLKMKNEKVQAQLSDKLLVKTDSATFSMDKEVKLDGQKILLNSPNQAQDKPPPDPKPPTHFALVDDKGKPLANQRFVIELDDGSQRTGVTDQEGNASIDLESGGKIRFPDLSEVASG